jgi:hypothetical protein
MLAGEFPMLGEDEYGLGQAEAMGDRAAADNGLDRQGAGSRKALACAGDDGVGVDPPRRLHDGLRRGGNPAGGLEQRLADLPAGMQRRRRAFRREQQSAALQDGCRRHAFGHIGTRHAHDPAGLLAAGRNHRLAGFEADAAGAVAEAERMCGQVAVRHVLSEPSAQLVVGDCQHLD